MTSFNPHPQTVTDRELDAIIAEKVMGFELRHADMAWSWDDWYGGDYPTEKSCQAIYNVTAPEFLAIPAYSKDIAAAFQVVEKMHALLLAEDDQWEHSNYLTLSCRGVTAGWAAAFTCVFESDEWFENPEQFGGALGDTAPKAICLAALKALGVEVPA